MKAEVIFVPGLLGDRWSFQSVRELLKDAATESVDYPPYPFSLEGFADLLAEKLKPGGYLVGTSMGGYVVLLAAVRNPSKVGGVVLINTFASPRRMLGWRRFIIKAIRKVPKGEWLKGIIRRSITDAHFGYDDRAKAYVLGVLERLTPDALYSRLLALAEAPEVKSFPKSVYGAVIYSEDDPTVPKEERVRLLNLVEPKRVVACSYGGHFPYLVNPKGFATLLRELINGTSPPFSPL
ncbi:MAG: alpha/beta hydrolase [Thermotogae bacterium]|nr:alpha/beta hydrolase [Thermotogota bacterium]